jgi:hypothetical protein
VAIADTGTHPPHRSTAMPRRIIRTITTAIAITALAAPTALARPADTLPAVAKAAAAVKYKQDAIADIHATQARDAASGRARDPRQDAIADTHATQARDAANGRAKDPRQDAIAGGNSAGSGASPAVIGLGIAGSLLVIAAVVGLGRRSRRVQRARVAA